MQLVSYGLQNVYLTEEPKTNFCSLSYDKNAEEQFEKNLELLKKKKRK